MTRFLAISGPSGVGKTTVMRELRAVDARYAYIVPYMTRPLRAGECDKISVTSTEFDALELAGAFIVVNELYGVRYGTPRAAIEEALTAEAFPMIDWPISKVRLLDDAVAAGVYCVYLSTGADVLRDRLGGRDSTGDRLRAGLRELEAVSRGAYDGLISLYLQADESPQQLARVIHQAFALSSTQRGGLK